MISKEHEAHRRGNVSYNNCSECRADTERRFVRDVAWHYEDVREYLAYVRPRLAAIREGETSVNAQLWQRKFIKALNTRISLKQPTLGRKQCDSYPERLKQFGQGTSASYLRRFAQRGASCLDG